MARDETSKKIKKKKRIELNTELKNLQPFVECSLCNAEKGTYATKCLY